MTNLLLVVGTIVAIINYFKKENFFLALAFSGILINLTLSLCHSHFWQGWIGYTTTIIPIISVFIWVVVEVIYLSKTEKS